MTNILDKQKNRLFMTNILSPSKILQNVDRLAADLVRKSQQIDINCDSILSIKSVHIIKQQIGTRNQAKRADRT